MLLAAGFFVCGFHVAFLGAWLGGKAFQARGSYDRTWCADTLLAVGAALLHLPIVEKRPAAAVAA